MNEIRSLSRVDLAAIVRAHLTTYTRDKTGREAPDRSRLLALDALADLETEVA